MASSVTSSSSSASAEDKDAWIDSCGVRGSGLSGSGVAARREMLATSGGCCCWSSMAEMALKLRAWRSGISSGPRSELSGGTCEAVEEGGGGRGTAARAVGRRGDRGGIGGEGRTAGEEGRAGAGTDWEEDAELGVDLRAT